MLFLGADMCLSGQCLTHHPHVHIIVPGGGLSEDSARWIACRPGFFLPVRVLSRLFRRLFLGMLMAEYAAGRLRFFGDRVGLADPNAFAAFIAPQAPARWDADDGDRDAGLRLQEPYQRRSSASLHP